MVITKSTVTSTLVLLSLGLNFQAFMWCGINSSLQKRLIALDRNLRCACIYGIINWAGRKCKQTWRKVKWNVSEGLKQLKLKEEDVPGQGWLYLEKNQKNVQWNSFKLAFRRKCTYSADILAGNVLPLVFYKMPARSSWSYL